MINKFYYKDRSVLDHRDYKKTLHRTDGPAVEYINGDKQWHINGKLHRIDGPAVEWGNGYKEWCINGKLHRTDGPAIEWSNGKKEWFINDKEYTEEEYNRHIWILKYL